jgi:hypothetical protein
MEQMRIRLIVVKLVKVVHTLGNHAVKNIEFIKSSMILLADSWEAQRLDVSD